MEAKEIRAFIKAFKQQQKLSLKSIKSDMTEEQMHYFKEGMEAGYADCIFILEDEIGA